VLRGKNQSPFDGKLNYDYIMWIDSDIIFQVQDFFTLLKHGDKDIVSGLYLMDGGKQYAVVKSWDEKFFTEHGTFQFLEPSDISDKKELIEVSYSGMGFMLIKRGVYENIDYPWFEPQHFTFQQNVSDFASEDVSFCKKAQEKGFKIYVDTSVIVGHEKTKILI
jgi:GT2 family glycosyltransferase